MSRKTSLLLVLALLLWLLPIHISAQALKVGIVMDGPFDRNQAQTSQMIKTAISAFDGGKTVEFPQEQRRLGDWSRNGVKKALDELLAEPNVDVVLMMGLLGSHEAVSRGGTNKPVVAARIGHAEWLNVPSKASSAGRVSGVRNLAYIAEQGVDLAQEINIYRQLVPFNNMVLLIAEPVREILPNLEREVNNRLTPLGSPTTRIIYVQSSLAPVLKAIPDEADAAFITALPQLEPGDFQKLSETLVEMKIPSFSLSGRDGVEMGLMAGVASPNAEPARAERIGSILRLIADGSKPEEIPVDLPLEQSLTVNRRVMAALGIGADSEPAAGAASASGMADGRSAAPSMAPVDERNKAELRMTPEEAEKARKQQERLFRDIQRAILRVQSYSAFDALSFRVEGSTVQLMGYAWRPVTASDAARRVQRVKGVETVENLIEVLPVSNSDDRLRGQLYINIYGHNTMQRYLRGGGLSPIDIRESLNELRFGIENVTLVRGPHPISIIVRNGHVALLGVVPNNLERTIAEQQANTTAGVFSVENHVQVAN